MDLRGAISNLLSLGAKLLPAVNAAPSSSSSPPVDQNNQIEAELKKLMRMLERIKATLYDAEQREITDSSVKLWLKELKEVAYEAEDVLGEHHYEVLRAKVEARDVCPPDSRKRKLIQVPHGMLDQIQQIRSRFDEIANDRVALQLSEGDGPRRCNNELQLAPTSHFVVESNIFGRESEKEKLIDLLSSKCDVVSVVTIVGMGGIGKTTLAQLAYNDQRIRQRFDKFGWICVSEDFNVERLTKELVECITENGCSLTNLSVLQEKVKKEISGKRVLLVLDDVWNEKKSLWNSFQSPFMSATFVKILVTTRNDHVAQIMQTEPTFNLGSLLAEQCWRLFEHYAFGGVEQKKSPKLVEIGKQLMNKCGMLPLAVKSIASLLRHEGEEESWRDILENELWESKDVCSEIFSPLQISYARLPTYLKPCFLYCSVFPKDYRYNVDYMVNLWVSQGFIESKENKKAEKVGYDYAQQLTERSFFDFHNAYGFKLHDIVHDLARHNSENCYYYLVEGSKLPIFSNVLYHLYINHYVNQIDLTLSDKFIVLRTLIIYFSENNFFNSTFDLSMAPKLRALDLSHAKSESLSSIGHLKHLCFLYLSYMLFETLPECICSLYNLQKLVLTGSRLKELPRKIGNLISLEELIITECVKLEVLPESLCQLKALRELYLIQCWRLEALPGDLGSLTNLQTLKIKNTGMSYLPESLCQLKALRELYLIRYWRPEALPGDLGSLTNLQTLKMKDTGVSYLPESLCQLKALRNLRLIKCTLLEALPGDLGSLTNLQTLKIRNTGVSYLPESLCQLKALRELYLIQCWRLEALPGDLGSLTNLHTLEIRNTGVSYLPESLYQLKALRELCLVDLKLKEALPSDLGSLTNLQTLKISGTGVSYLPPILSKVVGIQALMVSLKCNTIGWLKDFPDLGGTLCLWGLHRISNLMDVQCFNLVSMHNLEQLVLSWNEVAFWVIDNSVISTVCSWDRGSLNSNFLELFIKSGHNILHEDQSCFSMMLSLQPHPNLRKLTISWYHDITFPEWIGCLCKLKYLGIIWCDSLQFLKAEWLPLELEELRIYFCNELVSIPGIQKLKSLVKLCIGNCDNLCSFMGPSPELTCTGEGSSGSSVSLLGLTNLSSLRRLKISNCPQLQVLGDELPPVQPCNVEVFNCPGLKEWCLQLGINYEPC